MTGGSGPSTTVKAVAAIGALVFGIGLWLLT